MSEVYLQIDGGDPFVPEEIIQCETIMGTTEKTKPEDKVRNYRISSRVLVAHYVHGGLEYRNYYQDGGWVSHNGRPMFSVKQLLEFHS